ncbi:hypothetical protein BDW22DRAFT_90092 [Trametopsis cervina]|nr:hypothetical protein BDW22DRAFT_90092 [Trametopsis cervina]
MATSETSLSVDLPATSSVPIGASSAGRLSGKPWKPQKTAAVRSHLPDGVKTKSWEDRMQKTQKEKAIKQLQAELKEEKLAEIKRYHIGT